MICLRIYYLYEKSPKKLRELKVIHELMKETFEFDDGGVKPVRACGTRWVDHKSKAMKRILEKYGVFIAHLENVASEKSYSKKERARISGYVKEWKSSKVLVNLCFYIDILEPIRKLSLTFQGDKVDTVKAAQAIKKVDHDLEKLAQRRFSDFPHFKETVRKVTYEEEDENKVVYQNITLTKWDEEVEKVKRKKGAEINAVTGRKITAGHRTCPVKLASCPVNLMLKNNFVWTLSAHKHYPS